ncbi:MAG: DUF5615 family PIN-like protein [Acidimicrobiales bacterium]
MRLLLDAHVSGPGVGRLLEAYGHDVRAVDQEPDLEGLDDESLLGLAAEDGRILVTHNVSDFPRILRDWATDGRPHMGVILVSGIDHREFDLIVRGIRRWLEIRPVCGDWVDFPAVVDRRWASG